MEFLGRLTFLKDLYLSEGIAHIALYALQDLAGEDELVPVLQNRGSTRSPGRWGLFRGPLGGSPTHDSSRVTLWLSEVGNNGLSISSR